MYEKLNFSIKNGCVRFSFKGEIPALVTEEGTYFLFDKSGSGTPDPSGNGHPEITYALINTDKTEITVEFQRNQPITKMYDEFNSMYVFVEGY